MLLAGNMNSQRVTHAIEANIQVIWKKGHKSISGPK